MNWAVAHDPGFNPDGLMHYMDQEGSGAFRARLSKRAAM